MLNRKSGIKLFLVICLFLIIAGCFFLPKEKLNAKPELLPPPEDRITYAEVFRGPIEQMIRRSAAAEPVQENSLYFRQNGRVKDILIQYGQEVKAGDVLIILEGEDIEYSMKKQELNLEKAMVLLKDTRIKAELDIYTRLDVKIKEIDYELAKLEFDRLNKQYENLKLTAPFNGRITSLRCKEGDYVKAYEEIARITNPYVLHLIVDIGSSSLNDFRPGTPLRFEFYKDSWIPGKVVRVPSFGDKLPDGREDRRIFIELSKPDITLEYGALYPVQIIVKSKDNALQVAKTGVRFYFGEQTARLKDPSTGAITEAKLVLGIEGETTWEILSGLKEGDKVISK